MKQEPTLEWAVAGALALGPGFQMIMRLEALYSTLEAAEAEVTLMVAEVDPKAVLK